MSVAVSGDGTKAVSGDYDGSLRVWHLATGTQIARWDGDYPIFRCTALPGRPLKISIGQGRRRRRAAEQRSAADRQPAIDRAERPLPPVSPGPCRLPPELGTGASPGTIRAGR